MRHLQLFASIAALFVCLLAQSTAAEAPSEKASPKEAERLLATSAVFELFENKCNDCHGAHLERPKGKFGYIMDLDRVAANDEYVAVGNAAKS
ncbi:MAG: hypothetical protein EBS01_05150, partial [Verrucomicrobia bacterium]|nr:hypothetical protein [Verrucomicrobiota bacterium]